MKSLWTTIALSVLLKDQVHSFSTCLPSRSISLSTSSVVTSSTSTTFRSPTYHKCAASTLFSSEVDQEDIIADEEQKNEERKLALESLIKTETSVLNIPIESIPPITTSLNSTFAYNTYITNISATLPPNQASTSTLLLSIFNFMCNDFSSKAMKPNTTTLNIVLGAVVRSNQLEKARDLFRSVEKNNYINNENGILVPMELNTISYNILLNGYVHNQDMSRVLSTFQYQIQNKKQNPNIRPNLITLNIVLKAYAKSKQPKKAKQLFDRMESEYNIKPDVVSYTTVIDAHAQSGDTVGAETLLKIMIQKRHSLEQKSDQEYKKSHLEVQPVPPIQTFNAVLNAWSRSREKKAAQRAQNLLTLMVEMSSRKNADPSSIRIPRPNVSSYNTVLNAFSRIGDGLGAEELLDSMMDVDSPLYMETVPPDLISYNTVMSAYGRSGHIKCHDDVIRIMAKMTSNKLRPDVWSYTTLINAYTRSGEKDSPHKVDGIFQKMKDEGITPNVSTYNAIMNTWVKSGEWGSATRAHKLLLEMIEDSNIQNPNVRTFTIVIDAFAKSRERNAALKAQELLQYMEKQYETTHDSNLQPNVQTYTAVINAWGRSEEEGKARRALEVLNHMKDCYEKGKNNQIRPNVFSYNAVLNACAYTYGDDQEKDETFRTACHVFDELRNLKNMDENNEDSGPEGNYFRANHVTYGTFLQVCARLMPKGESMSRRTIVEAIFRKCCQDGQVGAYALDQLWEAAPRDLYWALLEEGGVGDKVRRRTWGDEEMVTVADLPAKWTRNVKERVR